MTKAVFIDAHGGPEVFHLRGRDLPAPAPGQIRVRHRAIGLNFIDIYQRKGLYPVSMPAVLGSEAAGVVEAIGEGVDAFSPGDRVAYISGGGGYAEEANVPAAMAAKVPLAVGDDVAAAVFLKGLTVEMLVRQVYPLKAGEACLVHAAAGLPGAAALDRDIEAPVRGNKPHAAFRLRTAPIAGRFPKSDGAPKSD